MNTKNRSPFGKYIEPLLKRRGWNASKLSGIESDTGKCYSRTQIGYVFSGCRIPSVDLLRLLYDKARLTTSEIDHCVLLIKLSYPYSIGIKEMSLSCEQKLLLINALELFTENKNTEGYKALNKIGEIL
jgi:hypothetical protein